MELLRSRIRVIRRKNHIPEEIYRKRWHTLVVLCLSLMVVMVGNTALNVALPVLAKELAASNSQLQWMVDSYSLVFAGLLFTAGALGDKYGRKGILQVGLVLFAAASFYAGIVAQTASDLIAARAIMGVSAAMIMPATLSILTNVFPSDERAKAVGVWAGVSGAGVALGPLLTGFIIEHYSWHAVFLINTPLIAATLLAGVFLVPRTADPDQKRIDIIGAVLSIVGLVSLVYAIIEAPHMGWLSYQTILTMMIGLVSLFLFVVWEKRTKNPMLDINLFSKPAFSISALVLTLVFFALMGIFFNMSQLLQLIYDYSPLESAVRMLPIAFTLMVVAPISPRIVDRFGKRLPVGGGMILVALGTLSMSILGMDSPYLQVVLSMMLVSSGMAVAMSPTTDLLMSAVPKNRAGMGSAMNDTTRELGASLGIAILGSLLASNYSSKISPWLGDLPDSARRIIEQSLTGALAVAEQVGGSNGQQLALLAKQAWLDSYRISLTVGAVIIAIAALITLKYLPNKADNEIRQDGYLEVDQD